ncbi:MBL fold metallo-hydrolase [Thermus thermamylovorans]|uniref:MBL fold metallo-hydrolase n=1 Tax=Thermus thermamylovorans TaxID=2509362 RepID=A0A4Q9B611_9DEIN|nr:MBL fold metallo-hydrolase [Thermus thermamylovorans]TBH21146.1 MBL fold metallo-hydrolase [Thermus thermamylovorans]
MRVMRVPVGPLQANAYLVVGPEGTVLIDPGGEAERLLSLFGTAGARPEAILLTHAHFDHLGAVAPLVEALSLPVYLHPLDLPLYRHAAEAARMWGLTVPEPPLPVEPLEEGMRLFGLEVLHLPGHSPGHVAFFHPGGEPETPPLVFSGDLLFRGGIGRYDLPGASQQALFRSLRRLLALPPKTEVHPGHGPETTLDLEARTNPFLTGLK